MSEEIAVTPKVDLAVLPGTFTQTFEAMGIRVTPVSLEFTRSLSEEDMLAVGDALEFIDARSRVAMNFMRGDWYNAIDDTKGARKAAIIGKYGPEKYGSLRVHGYVARQIDVLTRVNTPVACWRHWQELANMSPSLRNQMLNEIARNPQAITVERLRLAAKAERNAQKSLEEIEAEEQAKAERKAAREEASRPVDVIDVEPEPEPVAVESAPIDLLTDADAPEDDPWTDDTPEVDPWDDDPDPVEAVVAAEPEPEPAMSALTLSPKTSEQLGDLVRVWKKAHKKSITDSAMVERLVAEAWRQMKEASSE